MILSLNCQNSSPNDAEQPNEEVQENSEHSHPAENAANSVNTEEDQSRNSQSESSVAAAELVAPERNSLNLSGPDVSSRIAIGARWVAFGGNASSYIVSRGYWTAIQVQVFF